MKRNAFLIGVFVVAALLIVIASVFWLSGSNLFRQQQQALVLYEDNVSGLSVGAPVTFRGVSIGQVQEIGIRVDPQSLRTTVPVLLRLEASGLTLGGSGQRLDLEALVQRGLRARLVSQSIVTGQKAVELDFLPNTPAKLHGSTRYPEIPALQDRFGPLIEQVAGLPLRDTVEDIRGAVQELRSTLQAVEKTLSGAQTVLTGSAAELQKTGEASRQTLLAATEAIRQVQTGSQTALASVVRLAETSNQTVLAAQPELQRALVGARESAESARLAMERVADLSAPGAPLRSDLEASARDLSQAARGLRSLAELLEDKPNAILFGDRRE